MTYTPKLPPRAHQVEALEKSRNREGFGLFMEMGTGKTKVILDEVGRMHDGGDLPALLMVAPKGVYTNWETDEIPKHWPDDLIQEGSTRAIWRGGGTVIEREGINRLFTGDPTLKMLSMNIEAIGASDRAFEVAREFVKRTGAGIVVDESTAIKNPSAARTRALQRLGELSGYRRVLSGWPTPNGPLDIFSQMDFAVPGSLGRSFYGFRARYGVVQKQYFGTRAVQMVVGYRDLPELRERVRAHSFRKRKEECLDLPDKIYTPFRYVELTDQQRRIYAEVRDNATSQISEAGDHVTATLVLTQLLRMQQVLCGHVVDEEGRVHQLDSHRPQAVLDWTEEVRGCGVVWCAFQDDLQRVLEKLEKAYPGRVAEYSGRISQDACDVNKRRFQDGSADWFVGMLQKGARGLTLVRAADTLYSTNTQNLDHRLQSEDRTHRDGQCWPCSYSDLVAPGTIEETIIIPSHRRKIDLSTAVMGDPEKRWLV